MNQQYLSLWRSFANRWCHQRRRNYQPVNNNALMVALRHYYGMSWEQAGEFSQEYVEAWLIREEKRIYRSVRNAAVYAYNQHSVT